jgi:hypothetical protein
MLRMLRIRRDQALTMRVRRALEAFPAARPDLGPSGPALRDAVERGDLGLAGALLERHFIASELTLAASERLSGPEEGRAAEVEALLAAADRVRDSWPLTCSPGGRGPSARR